MHTDVHGTALHIANKWLKDRHGRTLSFDF